MTVLAHEHAAQIIPRQRRLELTQLVGVEFVDLDPVFAAQIPRKTVLFRAVRGAIDIKVAEAGARGPRLQRR
jgi:hypothetical protein